MPSPQHTTVVLTPEAHAVKDAPAPAYGLKRLLSAALVEFGKRSPQERESLVVKANPISKKHIRVAV